MWSSKAFLCVRVVGPVQALLDVLVRVGVRCHVDALRVTQQVAAPSCPHSRQRWRCTSASGAHAGTWSTRWSLMSSMKPMSSMRSASSSTSTSTWSSTAFPVLQVVESGGLGWKSECPAGRAAQLDLRWVRNATDDRRHAQPLHVAAVRRRPPWRPGWRVRASASQDQDARAVDHASFPALRLVLSPRAISTRCSAGRMNEAVLPLPVLAETIRSAPSSAGGIDCVWTSVAVSYPESATAFRRASCRPRLVKLMLSNFHFMAPPSVTFA